jgi:hypothetical protein
MLLSPRRQLTVMVNPGFACSSIGQPNIAWPRPSTGPRFLPVSFNWKKISLEMMKPYWNFGDSRRTDLSLDEFLDGQDPSKFLSGKEPWLEGVTKLGWQTFFRVCTEEMDDLSQRAVKLVIEYCLVRNPQESTCPVPFPTSWCIVRRAAARVVKHGRP